MSPRTSAAKKSATPNPDATSVTFDYFSDPEVAQGYEDLRRQIIRRVKAVAPLTLADRQVTMAPVEEGHRPPFRLEIPREKIETARQEIQKLLPDDFEVTGSDRLRIGRKKALQASPKALSERDRIAAASAEYVAGGQKPEIDRDAVDPGYNWYKEK